MVEEPVSHPKDRFKLAVVALGLFAAAMPPAQAAPDNTLGMAMLGAYVDAFGNLVSGSGVTAATRNSTGSYQVEFDRDIFDCFVTATPAMPVTLYVSKANNIASIFSHDSTGAFSDAVFNLIVFCAR
jgi:hypothetical protein